MSRRGAPPPLPAVPPVGRVDGRFRPDEDVAQRRQPVAGLPPTVPLRRPAAQEPPVVPPRPAAHLQQAPAAPRRAAPQAPAPREARRGSPAQAPAQRNQFQQAPAAREAQRNLPPQAPAAQVAPIHLDLHRRYADVVRSNRPYNTRSGAPKADASSLGREHLDSARLTKRNLALNARAQRSPAPTSQRSKEVKKPKKRRSLIKRVFGAPENKIKPGKEEPEPESEPSDDYDDDDNAPLKMSFSFNDLSKRRGPGRDDRGGPGGGGVGLRSLRDRTGTF